MLYYAFSFHATVLTVLFTLCCCTEFHAAVLLISSFDTFNLFLIVLLVSCHCTFFYLMLLQLNPIVLVLILFKMIGLKKLLMCWGAVGGRESQEAECAGWPRALRNRELQYSQSNHWSREPTELVHHFWRQSAAWLKFDMVDWLHRSAIPMGDKGGILLVQMISTCPPCAQRKGVGGGVQHPCGTSAVYNQWSSVY